MIPMLYQLSYAGRTLILAMPPELSNPARATSPWFLVRSHSSLILHLDLNLNLDLVRI